jgi:hypothetical protein
MEQINRDLMVLNIESTDYDILVDKARRSTTWIYSGSTAIKVIQRLTGSLPKTMTVRDRTEASAVLGMLGIDPPNLTQLQSGGAT